MSQSGEGLEPSQDLSMAIGFSPSTAIGSPHRRPSFLPTGGHEFSPRPGGRFMSVSGQGPHPFAGGRLREPVAVLPVGDDHVGVMQEPLDGRGREGLGHQLVESGWVDV